MMKIFLWIATAFSAFAIGLALGFIIAIQYLKNKIKKTMSTKNLGNFENLLKDPQIKRTVEELKKKFA